MFKVIIKVKLSRVSARSNYWLIMCRIKVAKHLDNFRVVKSFIRTLTVRKVTTIHENQNWQRNNNIRFGCFVFGEAFDHFYGNAEVSKQH